MNQHSSQHHKHEGEQRQQAAPAKVEFANAEQLLRHDAEQTAPPASIIERLNHSLAAEPLPKKTWWRKLFSR